MALTTPADALKGTDLELEELLATAVMHAEERKRMFERKNKIQDKLREFRHRITSVSTTDLVDFTDFDFQDGAMQL